MSLPEPYPLRQVLNDEVHSRPTEALWPQERVFHMALLVLGDDVSAAMVGRLHDLLDHFGSKRVAKSELAAPQASCPENGFTPRTTERGRLF